MPRVPLARPSVQTGYARSPDESEYPGLWRGLVTAWPYGMQGHGNKTFDFAVGNRYPGSFVNGPTWEPWEYGRAIKFNGTNQYITHSSFWNSNGHISISFWNKAGTATNGIGGFGNTSVGDRINIFPPYSDDILYFDYGTGTAGGGRVSTSYSSYLNKWTHIGLTSYGIDNAGMRIYLNGVSVASKSTSDYPEGNVSFSIGRTEVSPIKYHAGSVDAFYVFSRILNSSEMSLLYERPYAPFIPRRRIYGFTVAGAPAFPPNSLALTGVGR